MRSTVPSKAPASRVPANRPTRSAVAARLAAALAAGSRPCSLAQQPAAKQNIRVVADQATNSIIVRAKLIDMLTINKMVKEIDVIPPEQDQQKVTRVIGPLKHAHADDVAVILRDVYRTALSNQNAAGSRFQAGSEGRAALAAVRPVPRPWSPPADRSTCPCRSASTIRPTASSSSAGPLFADVQTLVEGLDKAASESKQMVKIISVRGADPYLVQQAIEAIQGRSTNANRGAQGTFTGTGTGNFGGGTPGGGGGFGGGGPGGGNLASSAAAVTSAAADPALEASAAAIVVPAAAASAAACPEAASAVAPPAAASAAAPAPQEEVAPEVGEAAVPAACRAEGRSKPRVIR